MRAVHGLRDGLHTLSHEAFAIGRDRIVALGHQVPTRKVPPTDCCCWLGERSRCEGALADSHRSGYVLSQISAEDLVELLDLDEQVWAACGSRRVIRAGHVCRRQQRGWERLP